MERNFQANRRAFIYKKLKESHALRGKVISPHFLKESVALVNNRTSYEFPFRSSNPADEFPDVKLSDKDVFIVIGMALCLAAVDTTKEGAEVLYAYPNSEAFGLTGVTPADLNAIYNAYISATIGQTEVFTRLATQQFRDVPETYREATNLNLNHDSYQGWPGMKDLDISLILNGQQDNKFNLNLPTFSTAPQWVTSVTNTEIRAIMILDGLIVKGAAFDHFNAIQSAIRGEN